MLSAVLRSARMLAIFASWAKFCLKCGNSFVEAAPTAHQVRNTVILLFRDVPRRRSTRPNSRVRSSPADSGQRAAIVSSREADAIRPFQVFTVRCTV